MKEYSVRLKDRTMVIVQSKYVKVKHDNSLIFYNDRKSLSDQYLNGPEIVATFNPGEYSYFVENQINVFLKH